MGTLEDMERELGITGEVGEAEARGARVTLRRLFLDVEQAIAHRRAVGADGSRIDPADLAACLSRGFGHGGPLGAAPPSALLYLAGLLGVDVEVEP